MKIGNGYIEFENLSKCVDEIAFASHWSYDEENIYISCFTIDFIKDVLEENSLNNTDKCVPDIWAVVPRDVIKNTVTISRTNEKFSLCPVMFKKMLIFSADPEFISLLKKDGAGIKTDNENEIESGVGCANKQ